MHLYEDPKSGEFGLKLHLEIRTHWLSRVSTHPGGAVVNIQVPSTRGCGFLLEQPSQDKERAVHNISLELQGH